MTALPSRQPEVLVVGLGAMGSATLLHLARRGADVLGIDQYDPPHVHGSTHGETRITREAVGEGAAFVPLAIRSHVLWREIERDTEQSLLEQCGGLVFARAGLASHMHEQNNFLGNTIKMAREFGITHELLDARAMHDRFPQLNLLGDETGYFEPGAGYLRPEACVAAQLQLARASGARIHTGERIRAIRRDGQRAIVETDQATYAPGVTILCAGPWLPGLLPDALPHTLTVRRQVLYWFEAENVADYASERFPIFIWNWGSGPTDVFYGFPGTEHGVKVATEQMIEATTPETVTREVGSSEADTMYRTHVEGRLNGVTARCTQAVACLYTCAPGANFLIDRLPDCAGVIVVSACSGHGFKHSAAIGEAVAEMARTGTTPKVLEPFRF